MREIDFSTCVTGRMEIVVSEWKQILLISSADAERSKDSVGYLDNNICLGQVRSAAIVCASNCMEATSVLQGTG